MPVKSTSFRQIQPRPTRNAWGLCYQPERRVWPGGSNPCRYTQAEVHTNLFRAAYLEKDYPGPSTSALCLNQPLPQRAEDQRTIAELRRQLRLPSP